MTSHILMFHKLKNDVPKYPPCNIHFLAMCTAAMVLLYIWYTHSISYSYSTDTEVLPVQPVASDLLRSSPNIVQKRSRAHDVHTENNSGKVFVPQYVRKKKKLKAPPLPKTLPYAAYLRSVEEIQKASWTTQLYGFLKTLNHSISPQVNMVFGDSHHVDLVLNWIIAAHLRLNPPLHNIMVLSVDQLLCNFLRLRKLSTTCIAVPSKTVLAFAGNISYEQRIKTRLIVLRVINYWGYDVASYDSDAILLRNPQHLFDSNLHVQVFSAAAYYPRSTLNAWGFSICGGTLILRSHPSTENLWKYIHSSNTTDECEQCLWNHAMENLGVVWNVTTKRLKVCKLHSGWQSDRPLPSIVFPQRMFCRQCCTVTLLHRYYVVHPNNRHLDTYLKQKRLERLRSWFLRDDWRDFRHSSLKGNQWLFSIYSAIYRET